MSRNSLEEAISSRGANVLALRKIDELIRETLAQKPTYGYSESDITRLEGKQDLAEEIRDILDAVDVYTGLDV